MPVITTDIDLIIRDLLAGKPAAIPTETVYGLAALIDSDAAIRAVFSLKNRPLTHPLIVHVAPDYDISTMVAELPAYAQLLIKAFWPGPLTLVLRSKAGYFNPLITGGQPTVAIRCPAHPVTQALLSKLLTPVVAPSANPFGKISPTTAMHVEDSFAEAQLTILDGGRCQVGIESTIIDATQMHSYQILRHGLIEEQAIAEVIATPAVPQNNDVRVPGKLASHYQPQKTLYYFADYAQLALFCAQNNAKTYVIAQQCPDNISKEYFHPLALQPEQAAFELYFQLRQADASAAHCIAIQLPPATSPWQGVRERIFKAGCRP